MGRAVAARHGYFRRFKFAGRGDRASGRLDGLGENVFACPFAFKVVSVVCELDVTR
jgi:hypothetical protein